MNILVFVKQVPDTEARIRLKDTPGVARDVKFIMSPFDEFALEEAIRLKEKHGGTITVISLGPDRAKEVLKTCLAVGADRAVLVTDAALAGSDGLGVATALAAAAKKYDHDLILLGKKAVGVDRGQVGPQISQLLGLPFVSQVSHLETADGKTFKVEREIEGGQEVLEVTLPAVLSAEKTANELRHASLKGIMQSKSKPVQTLSLGDLGLTAADVAPRVRFIRMEHPPERQAGRVVSGGDAVGMARELVRVLHDEAKII